LFRKAKKKRDMEALSVEGKLILNWMIKWQQLMMIKKQRFFNNL